MTSLDDLRQDVRHAAKALRQDVQFSVLVIATIGVTIGPNAVMFGMVDRLLVRGPEHIRDADQVVRLYLAERSSDGTEFTSGVLDYATYDLVRNASHAFQDVAAYATIPGTTGRGADARKVNIGHGTASYFPLLGVTPALGRFFTRAEDAPSGAQHVAVIGHGLWQSAFGKDSSVLGRTITINDEAYLIVGVAPRGFTGADLGRVDLWLPISVLGPRLAPDWATVRGMPWVFLIGRLRKGVTSNLAGTDATAAYRHASDVPEAGRLLAGPLVLNAAGAKSTEASISQWLVAIALIVLLIACANVTNLLTARATRRRREIAVRLALGASRWRVSRLFLCEAMILSLAGAAVGMLVAGLSGGFVRNVLLPDIDWGLSPIDVRVLAVTAMLALATGLLVGLMPTLQASRSDLTLALKTGDREGGGRRARARGVLTMVQAALSVLLLIGAGLFVRSLQRVDALDFGVEPGRVIVASINWPRLWRLSGRAEYTREMERRTAFLLHALEEIRQLAVVERAAVAMGMPFRNSATTSVRVPGRDSLPPGKGTTPQFYGVTSDYFRTVGTPIRRGRPFLPSDRRGSERVTIVSESMAKALWPSVNPLGQCLFIGGDTLPCARVVGVAGDTRGLYATPRMLFYVPLEQVPFLEATMLAVRSGGNVLAVGNAVRHAIVALDPAIELVETKTIQQYLDPQLRPWRLGATMFAVLGGVALLIAAVGLYSVVSYLTAQRSHEIGVRVALGATGANILLLILRGSVGMTALGAAIGIIGALAAGPYIEPLLFQTSARDPMVITMVAATMLVVAVGSGVVSALRATPVYPMEVLRSN